MSVLAGRPKLRPSALMFGLLLSTQSALVRAQAAISAPDSGVAAARSEFRQASSLAAGQAWAEALRHYEAAYSLFAHPTTLYNIGVCHEKLGDDAQAFRFTLLALRAKQSDASTLAPEIRAQAEVALKALESRVAVVELESHGATLRVEVDGRRTTLLSTETDDALFVDSQATLESVPFAGSARLILDPGPHQITLRDGSRGETLSFTTVAGSRTSFQWSSPAPSQTSSPAVAQPAPRPPLALPPTHNHPLQHAAVGSLIVGGASLVVGVVAGGVALSAKNQLDRMCNADGTCPRSESSTLSRFETASTISSVGFAVGLVASAAGVSLLLLSPPTTKAPPPFALRLAPTQIALLASF
jgi:hypothetical protein